MVMTEPVKTDRYGVPLYAVNPSLEKVSTNNKPTTQALSPSKTRAVLYDEITGEHRGQGTVSVVTREVVDNEKFMKVYAAAMPVLEDLSKNGFKVFSGIWKQVQESAGLDRVELTAGWFARHGFEEINARILGRTLKELLSKEVIYKSTVQGMYYYNVKLIYNGTRIPALNLYHQYVNANYVTTGSEDQKELFSLSDDEPA